MAFLYEFNVDFCNEKHVLCEILESKLFLFWEVSTEDLVALVDTENLVLRVIVGVVRTVEDSVCGNEVTSMSWDVVAFLDIDVGFVSNSNSKPH